jgi:hypothetical protein
MRFNSVYKGLNPICHLLALLEAHPILHVSRIRLKIHCQTKLLRQHLAHAWENLLDRGAAVASGTFEINHGHRHHIMHCIYFLLVFSGVEVLQVFVMGLLYLIYDMKEAVLFWENF